MVLLAQSLLLQLHPRTVFFLRWAEVQRRPLLFRRLVAIIRNLDVEEVATEGRVMPAHDFFFRLAAPSLIVI